MTPIFHDKALNAAMAMALGSTLAGPAQAALPAGAVLYFSAGYKTCVLGGTAPNNCNYGVTSTKGSWFSMDSDGNGSVSDSEKTPIAPNYGLAITTDPNIDNTNQPTSEQSHSGAPTGSEVTTIDMAWGFFNNSGMHNTTSAVTVVSDDGAGNVVLDMSGWRVDWNGIEDINMGGDTANFPSDTGQATLTCATDCSAGDTFTLQYAAHVPLGDASGFGGVPYSLYLEGTVQAPFSISDDAAQTAPGTSVDIDVTANDTFEFYGSGSPEAVDNTTLAITSPPSNGTAALNGTKITYTPNTGVSSGTTDTFQYRVKNKGGAWSASATVTVTIASTPAAGTVSTTTAQGSAVTINVLSNTIDPDNSLDPTTTVITTQPSYGSVTNNGDGTVVYVPNDGFLGDDSFGFKVSNNVGQSNEGTVTVRVDTKAPASASGTLTSDNGLTAAEVGTDEHVARQCVGGCFDFKVSGLNAGDTAIVVLPLTEAIPDVEAPLSVQYRKLIDGKWVPFTPTADDKIQSTEGQAGQCPPPGDGSYGPMTAGHYCLQLTIKDGGPNDADGLENGTVVDPGGIAVRDMYATKTSGCTIARSPADPLKHVEWWLLGGLLALLGMRRRKA